MESLDLSYKDTFSNRSAFMSLVFISLRFQIDPFCIAYFKHLRFPIVFIVLGPGYRDAFSLKAQQYCYVSTLPLRFHNMNTEQFENVSM